MGEEIRALRQLIWNVWLVACGQFIDNKGNIIPEHMPKINTIRDEANKGVNKVEEILENIIKEAKCQSKV